MNLHFLRFYTLFSIRIVESVGNRSQQEDFNLGRYNTEDQIDFAIEKIPITIAQLREISSFVAV